jgi:xanthine dehydrogenase YagS FAD-binding subunit
VAAWVAWDGDTVRDARVVLGGVASFPKLIAASSEAIVGTDLDDDAIAAAAQAAFKPAKPMDNTDFGLAWRKEMTRNYVRGALEELRSRHREA